MYHIYFGSWISIAENPADSAFCFRVPFTFKSNVCFNAIPPGQQIFCRWFAGEQWEQARYYVEDKAYLLSFEELATHFDVLEHPL
jgi:hypothetical protein